MAQNSSPGRRCAVYTRKSSEEGLHQDFNSIHAQREAGEAYIRSQASEGWRLIKTAYDDGGLSGGNMERPALQRLLADIRARQVDVVVVYKVDRLTRSLMDFAKIVEEFDRHGVSFVAVTQQFNTTTSMGRLTLNVLLSFAQFEREVTTERIRDKIAASKRKGMWMGGNLPIGYDVENRKLIVNKEEAKKSTFSPLAGKLFDVSGNRLVPSHTVKKGRRYRYYISEKLVSGRAQDADRAWRLPALEVETAVAAEVAKVLGEPATIMELADKDGARRQIPALLQRIETAEGQLNCDDTRAEALATLVHRVVIDAHTVGIDISVASFLADEGITGESDVIRRDVSLKLSRRGVETQLIIGGIDRGSARSNPALVKLVARTRNWWDTLAALNGLSLEQMAVHVKLPERYFSKKLQLAFLAPSIVEDIVAGRHPRHVGRQLLIDTATLPISWRSQKTLLGWTE